MDPWEEEENDSSGEGLMDAPSPGADFMTLDPEPPEPASAPVRKTSMDPNKLIFTLLGVTAFALIVTVIIIVLKKM
jgi:hypothetical protein